ncbi:MAG: hypothetical protein AAGH71_03650 [Planctomycetota bacterium]
MPSTRRFDVSKPRPASVAEERFLDAGSKLAAAQRNIKADHLKGEKLARIGIDSVIKESLTVDARCSDNQGRRT